MGHPTAIFAIEKAEAVCCSVGKVQRTISNHRYMRLHIDKWKENGASTREIAELTGKSHFNVMKAIRNMEPAWVNVGQFHFELTSYTDAQGKERPCYSLTKTECLLSQITVFRSLGSSLTSKKRFMTQGGLSLCVKNFQNFRA